MPWGSMLDEDPTQQAQVMVAKNGVDVLALILEEFSTQRVGGPRSRW